MAGRKRTILVVDELDGVRRLIRDILVPEGYEVIEARDEWGAACVAETHDGVIDLVLTDFDMPFVGGPGFARRLARRQRPAPVLVMSGRDDAVLERCGLHPGSPDFIAKPFLPPTLVRKVAALLESVLAEEERTTARVARN